MDSTLAIHSISKPTSVSDEFLTFDNDDELVTFAFVVPDDKVNPVISLIQTMASIHSGYAVSMITERIKVTNFRETETRLEDTVFMITLIKQLLEGNAKVVGENLHLLDGKYIVPDYKKRLRDGAMLTGVITTEEAEYELYI